MSGETKPTRPTFELTAEENDGHKWGRVVTHAAHLNLRQSFRRYDAEPPGDERRVADLLAWGSTFVCSKCGPICPMCGGAAEMINVMGVRPGWGHAPKNG